MDSSKWQYTCNCTGITSSSQQPAAIIKHQAMQDMNRNSTWLCCGQNQLASPLDCSSQQQSHQEQAGHQPQQRSLLGSLLGCRLPIRAKTDVWAPAWMIHHDDNHNMCWKEEERTEKKKAPSSWKFSPCTRCGNIGIGSSSQDYDR